MARWTAAILNLQIEQLAGGNTYLLRARVDADDYNLTHEGAICHYAQLIVECCPGKVARA